VSRAYERESGQRDIYSRPGASLFSIFARIMVKHLPKQECVSMRKVCNGQTEQNGSLVRGRASGRKS
jgi:hypothetical protein